MANLTIEAVANYAHSPVHYAVARQDYAALRRIISALPRLAKAGEIRTETDSAAEEQRADALSAVIDRRDVPGRETPLHLAVRLADATAAGILMAAGADWSLQNEQGWSALQEAVCTREEAVAMVILRYYQPMAWAKWCRRLPRVVTAMQRMRDFYMELTFHFESSVIPFIGRIAPSDTYRIWKRGSNLRADMTLAGFDGFRIHRSDQSFLFFGEGSDDGKLPPGYLCMLSHKDKEVLNALEGAGSQPTEAEIAKEVAAMSQNNMYRPGIDVTQAELVPQFTWRRQEKTEMVGPWKAKMFEMHHVTASVKSRRVVGAMADEDLFSVAEVGREDGDLEEEYGQMLTEEEKKQLETALKMDSLQIEDEVVMDGRLQFSNAPGSYTHGGGLRSKDEEPRLSSASVFERDWDTEIHSSSKGEKKGWFSWGRRSFKQEGGKKMAPPRSSLCIDGKVSDLLGEGSPGSRKFEGSRRSVDSRSSDFRVDESYIFRRGKDNKKLVSRDPIHKHKVAPSNDGTGDSEYKKGLRPILWLTPDFPLKTEELLPLLDILANKVKAVRRLRDLLTTKLPTGTFPVKVAIPVVPTVRVVVTFTKFEELRASEEFATPPTSPGHLQDTTEKDGDSSQHSSNSWFSWIKGSANRVAGMSGATEDHPEDVIDPFAIPNDYIWTSINARKRRGKDRKSKVKKGRKFVSDGLEHEGEG